MITPKPTWLSPFKKAFLFVAVASLIPIWAVKYLPMVDMPQHVAQLSIMKNYHNPLFGFEGLFEFHWFSPYLLAMSLARFFAVFFDVLGAFKIIISISILLLPLSLWVLFKQSGGDEWWALLGFPFSYSVSFYGVLSATPLQSPSGSFYSPMPCAMQMNQPNKED